MKNKAGKGILPDFNYYKATIIKMTGYWHKDKQRKEQNGIKDSKISLYTYRQLTSTKEKNNTLEDK